MKVVANSVSPGASRRPAGRANARPWLDEIARMRCLVARWICTWGGPHAGAAG